MSSIVVLSMLLWTFTLFATMLILKRVRVVHVHGADQIADTLTKALSKSAFESNLFMLGLVTHRLT